MTEEFKVKFYNSSIKNKENISILKKSLILRKNVYCDELGFESATEYENDLFDMFSAGSLILFNNQPVATSRIIFNTEFSLPSLKVTESTVLKDFLEKNPYTCEISRFLVLQKFRNIHQFNLSEFNYSTILLFLYLSIFSLSDYYKIPNMIFLCEKKLIKKLKIFGINVVLLDENPYFHKKERFICLIKLDELHTLFNKIELMPLLKLIKKEIITLN